MTWKQIHFVMVATLLVVLFGGAFTWAEREPTELHHKKFVALKKKLATLKRLAKSRQFVVEASREIIFPQVAHGVSGSTGISTVIILTNAGDDDFVASLRLRRSTGGPMSVNLVNLVTEEIFGSGSTLSVPIPAFSSVFLETDEAGDLAVGWASASAPSGKQLGGVAMYIFFDRATGQISATVGVGASSAASAFSVPVVKNDVQGMNTALALANSSSRTVRLKGDLLDSEGEIVSSEILTLGPTQQSAKFIQEIFSGVGRRFHGTVHFSRVDADGGPDEALDVHPMALFQTGGLFTSAPVTRGKRFGSSDDPLRPGESFDLDSDNRLPHGITFVNDKLYVVDWSDDKVYAYHPSGRRDAAADFDLDSDNSQPRGITFANSRFYVVDGNQDTVYVYHPSGRRDATADFELEGRVRFPHLRFAEGITFGNSRVYVVEDFGAASDTTLGKVYVYHPSGRRIDTDDFDLDPDNRHATGITFANSRLYVVDEDDLKVYAYHPSGRRDAAADFDLATPNRRAHGITFANGRFYVVNFIDNKVYAY